MLLLFVLLVARRLVQHIDYADRRQRTDQKYHIEPPVIEVKVQTAQHLGDDYPVLGWHVHAHQQHRRAEVHAHDLRHHQHNDVRRLAGRDLVEELGQREQQPADRRHHNAADQKERHMLAPEGHVHVEAAPVHGDLEAARNRILFAHAIEHDVDRANEDLPQAVQAEEVAEHIEVLALQRARPALALLHVTQCVHLKEQLARQLLESGDLEAQLADV